jgi:uncharacterized membrane protein
MSSDKPSHDHPLEPRWPIILTVLGVLVLLEVLPGRIRPFPVGVSHILGMMVLVPMAAVGLTRGKVLWRRIERITMMLFFLATCGGNLLGIASLIRAMLGKAAELSGLQLFTSSISVWVINVLMFSLMYWQIDRGGPEARITGMGTRPDWLFAQESAPAGDVPPGWKPSFVDYLFLGYSTATAFSTTDVMPLTSRAKLLMMMESTISLATIVVIAARAINILGS